MIHVRSDDGLESWSGNAAARAPTEKQYQRGVCSLWGCGMGSTVMKGAGGVVGRTKLVKCKLDSNKNKFFPELRIIESLNLSAT